MTTVGPEPGDEDGGGVDPGGVGVGLGAGFGFGPGLVPGPGFGFGFGRGVVVPPAGCEVRTTARVGVGRELVTVVRLWLLGR
ncbi:MAG: hypothetical protein WCF27_12725 [Gaiellaceae bacterium]